MYFRILFFSSLLLPALNADAPGNERSVGAADPEPPDIAKSVGSVHNLDADNSSSSPHSPSPGRVVSVPGRPPSEPGRSTSSRNTVSNTKPQPADSAAGVDPGFSVPGQEPAGSPGGVAAAAVPGQAGTIAGHAPSSPGQASSNGNVVGSQPQGSQLDFDPSNAVDPGFQVDSNIFNKPLGGEDAHSTSHSDPRPGEIMELIGTESPAKGDKGPGNPGAAGTPVEPDPSSGSPCRIGDSDDPCAEIVGVQFDSSPSQSSIGAVLVGVGPDATEETIWLPADTNTEPWGMAGVDPETPLPTFPPEWFGPPDGSGVTESLTCSKTRSDGLCEAVGGPLGQVEPQGHENVNALGLPAGPQPTGPATDQQSGNPQPAPWSNSPGAAVAGARPPAPARPTASRMNSNNQTPAPGVNPANRAPVLVNPGQLTASGSVDPGVNPGSGRNPLVLPGASSNQQGNSVGGRAGGNTAGSPAANAAGNADGGESSVQGSSGGNNVGTTQVVGNPDGNSQNPAGNIGDGGGSTAGANSPANKGPNGGSGSQAPSGPSAASGGSSGSGSTQGTSPENSASIGSSQNVGTPGAGDRNPHRPSNSSIPENGSTFTTLSSPGCTGSISTLCTISNTEKSPPPPNPSEITSNASRAHPIFVLIVLLASLVARIS